MHNVRPCAAAVFAAALSVFVVVSDASASPVLDPAFTTAFTQVCAVPSSPCQSSLFTSGDGPQSFNDTGGPSSSSLSRAEISVPGGVNLAGNAAMFIEPGIFNTFVSTSGSMRLDGVGAFFPGSGYSASAFGRDSDSLSIASGAFLDLPIHLTGGVNIGFSVAGGQIFSSTDQFASVSLNLGCFAHDVGGFLAKNCSQKFDFTSSADVDSIIDFVIPFTAGTPFDFDLLPTLVAEIQIPFFIPTSNDEIVDFQGHAVGDFSHTGVFGPATVLDANMNPLLDVPIVSSSGFDYAAGFAEAPSAVPEPATLTLFGVGLAGLGFIRRRRAA